MGVVLEVIEGPGVGTKYEVEAGNTLGGGGCDHVLKDPLISYPSLRIDIDEKGRLQALNISKENSIFLNKKKVHKVVLLHGVNFKVGATLLRVISANEEAQNSKVKPWPIILFDNLHSHIFSTSRSEHFGAFTPPLQIRVLAGSLAGSEYIIGFGPREFGYNCFDFDLDDPELPERAFSLIPGHNPVLKALSEDKVFLNGEPVIESAIADGDEVNIGSFRVKISFLASL